MPIIEDNQLSRIEIVLVDTQTDENIGAVCRAMKTMGLSRLVLVSSRNYDDHQIRKMAIHAYDLYEKHTRFSSLKEALQNSSLSVGATRRRGKFRKYFSYLPHQLAEQVQNIGGGTVSIVFGRESDGLTVDELQLCDAAVRIPTSRSFPSLNLAQAVQIICWELRRNLTAADGFQPVTRTILESTTETLADSLEQIGFFKQDEKEEVRRFYRDILARAGLSRNEAARIEKHFRKIAGIKIHKEQEQEQKQEQKV